MYSPGIRAVLWKEAYKAVPPPTGTILPPRENVSFTGIDELAIRNKVVNQEKTKSSQSEPSNKPKLINLREHRVQGTQDQFGTTSKGLTIVISQETLGTARPKVPHAVLSQSTGRPYYPRMDNTRPRTSSFSRTPHRPQRPKKIVKSIWVKKGSTVGTQAV
ncbi:hypothetical protein Tco_0400209, partial [Tanacetum coccineum]